MDYLQTLDYLFTRLPMFSRIGAAAYKADLHNTLQLCAALDNPQSRIKTIHVAGTNGKGSVSHMLAAVLQGAGYKTGLYTSPHLKDFRERIKVNGKMISESFVIEFTEKIKPLAETIEPSFFELTVAMAFDYFAKEETGIAVIETGLGGRLDSTNVIVPDLSVITNIGWDHQQLLGDSLEKIASEKAGIIKNNIPVVIGEFLPETRPVFQQTANQKQAPLSFASEKRQVTGWNWTAHELVVEVAAAHKEDHKIYHLDLQGIYQKKNVLTVLEALSQLKQKGWNIPDKAITEGLAHTKKMTGLHGRWEIIHTNPLVVLDVAHNADGMQQLLQQVEVTTHNQLHLVIGMVRDKEIEKVLSLLPKNAEYYFTKAGIPRALTENELMERAKVFGLKGKAFPDVNKAIASATGHAHPDDLILVAGSVFLVGEVTTY